MKVFLNWLLFLLVVGGIVAIIWHRHWIGQHLPSLPQRGRMTGPQVIVFSLAFAFMWVEILKWGVVKPFNCLKCMAGWSALIFAFMFHVDFWYMYLPLGLFVGSVFEGIKMRWL